MGAAGAVIKWVFDPTNLTAISTLVIALFTVALAIVGWSQARLIRKSIDLARKEFVSSQRPKLRVRNVVVNNANFPIGHQVSGQFYVSNIGGTAARITESHCIVYWSGGGLPMKRPYEGADGNMPIGKVTINSGESYPALFLGDKLATMKPDPSRRILGGASVYVMGWVEYRDEIDIRRRTAFCREFRLPDGEAFHQGRFYPVEDHDYEHEE